MTVRAIDVMRVVATHHGFTVSDLRASSRKRPLARARQQAMYAIRVLCPHMSYPMIGTMLGGRDHTTVLHGVRRMEAFLAAGIHVDDLNAIMNNFSGAYLEHRITSLSRELAGLIALRNPEGCSAGGAPADQALSRWGA